MPTDYSFPSWMVPRSEPWQAMVAGVQAGSQIAATRQRGQALGMQLRHQAFQEEASKAKFDSDQADLARLQEWWPSFVSAEGDALRALQAPPLKNATMWNRVTMELEKRKQQSAASEFANVISTEDLAQPEGQAKAWRASKGLVAPEHVAEIINKQVTAKRMEDAANSLSTYRDRMATVAEEKLEQFQTPEGPVEGVAVSNPDGTTNKDFFATRSATGKGWTIHRQVGAPKLSPTGEAGIIKSQISDIEKALEDLPGAGTRGEKSRGTEAQRKELQGKLDKLRADRDALRHPEEAKPAAATKRVRVREKATGKTGWWEGGAVPAEYETIPE